MKRINLKNLSDTLVDRELKNITGGNIAGRICITCITAYGEEYVGDYNGCYFELCGSMDGVRCVNC